MEMFGKVKECDSSAHCREKSVSDSDGSTKDKKFPDLGLDPRRHPLMLRDHSSRLRVLEMTNLFWRGDFDDVLRIFNRYVKYATTSNPLE